MPPLSTSVGLHRPWWRCVWVAPALCVVSLLPGARSAGGTHKPKTGNHNTRRPARRYLASARYCESRRRLHQSCGAHDWQPRRELRVARVPHARLVLVRRFDQSGARHSVRRHTQLPFARQMYCGEACPPTGDGVRIRTAFRGGASEPPGTVMRLIFQVAAPAQTMRVNSFRQSTSPRAGLPPLPRRSHWMTGRESANAPLLPLRRRRSGVSCRREWKDQTRTGLGAE
jgi:hypothetical protein